MASRSGWLLYPGLGVVFEESRHEKDDDAFEVRVAARVHAD